ncbi:MAG TPA: hypothetical protein VGV37_08085 [Aliidongia sp.]|uniref:hypothetical protein n=1 Tax=Aliidongia sp. TaxID=1914230 RepID=UPI002DDC9072|nr:hypothetical protein [Aliidongia sp.]HEV2674485.1 hypothetical protein [Aliidongia sp.]
MTGEAPATRPSPTSIRRIAVAAIMTIPAIFLAMAEYAWRQGTMHPVMLICHSLFQCRP